MMTNDGAQRLHDLLGRYKAAHDLQPGTVSATDDLMHALRSQYSVSRPPIPRLDVNELTEMRGLIRAYVFSVDTLAAKTMNGCRSVDRSAQQAQSVLTAAREAADPAIVQ